MMTGVVTTALTVAAAIGVRGVRGVRSRGIYTVARHCIARHSRSLADAFFAALFYACRPPCEFHRNAAAAIEWTDGGTLGKTCFGAVLHIDMRQS